MEKFINENLPNIEKADHLEEFWSIESANEPIS
jgi:hypothetical protein